MCNYYNKESCTRIRNTGIIKLLLHQKYLECSINKDSKVTGKILPTIKSPALARVSLRTQKLEN
jgi:hypothetical protein